MASISGTLGRMRSFLTETRSEMKKVTFPSREEVVGTTVVVLVASVIFAIYLWIADQIILQVFGWIYQVIG
ncbi:MAG: preprotein translocase subunit SecE [Thermoanaerobaculia bacterium]